MPELADMTIPEGVSQEEAERAWRFATKLSEIYVGDANHDAQQQFQRRYMDTAGDMVANAGALQRRIAGLLDCVVNDRNPVEILNRVQEHDLPALQTKLADCTTLINAFARGERHEVMDEFLDRILQERGERDPAFFFRELMALYGNEDFTSVKYVFEGEDGFDRGIQFGENCRGQERIEVVTRVTTLEGNDGHCVDFPPWQLTVGLDRLRDMLAATRNQGMMAGMRLAVAFGHEPNRSNNERGMWHPHVDNGGLCQGAARALGGNALRQGVISDAFFVLFAVLNTYNHEGDFNDLRHWDDGAPRCSVCRGRFAEGDERVNCTVTGVEMHPTCARELDGQHYHPEQVYTCPICESEGVRTTIARQIGSVACCANCEGRVQAQVDAANRGDYLCHNCGTLHERGNNPRDQMVEMRNGWFLCINCAVPHGTNAAGQQQYLVDGQLITAGDRRFRRQRVTPRPAEVTECACGAWRNKDLVITDVFGVSTCCPECDPDGLELSRALLADMTYLEGLVSNFFSIQIDQFTSEFVQWFSPLACELTVEETVPVVKRLREVELGRRRMPPSAQMLLADYVREVNQLTADVSPYPLLMITANRHEVQFYDEEIRRRNPGRFDQEGQPIQEERPEEGFAEEGVGQEHFAQEDEDEWVDPEDDPYWEDE